MFGQKYCKNNFPRLGKALMGTGEGISILKNLI